MAVWPLTSVFRNVLPIGVNACTRAGGSGRPQKEAATYDITAS